MVLASSAHAAFAKASHYFGIRSTRVPVGEDYRADVDAMAAAIEPDTVLVVGSAPSYPQGVIDPIPELAALAAERGALCHVDACMGGFVLPFLERLGHVDRPWDFRVPGVTSISADLHKYGYAPKGVSTVTYRDRALRRHQTFVFDGWLGGAYGSPAMAGTRSGAPLAAAWAVLHHLGEEGYLRLVERSWGAAQRLQAGVRAIPELAVRGEPDATVFAFGAADPEALDVFALGDELAARGWYLDRQTPPDSLHATVSAVHDASVDELVADLGEAVARVGGGRTDDRSTTYATLE
jgi:glutamate/tyrosine decarboxylase-like PLP-dependent enzyme